MTIEELEVFVSAAESEMFVAPNGDLHRYSSSASKEIITLEQELGCVLFDRREINSGILTDAGAAFLPLAKNLIRTYRMTLRRMDQFRTEDRRSLYIGHLPILRQYRLSSFFEFFRDDNMECEMHMEEGDARTLVEDLDSGYYDAIVIRRNLLFGSGYRTVPMAGDEVAAIVSTDHPAAAMASITLPELKNESFYLSNPYSGSYSFCKQLLIKNHISTENVHTADIDKILDVVRNTRGVALLPISTLNVSRAKGVTAVPLKPKASMSVVLACRRDHPENQYLDELMRRARERSKAIPAL